MELRHQHVLRDRGASRPTALLDELAHPRVERDLLAEPYVAAHQLLGGLRVVAAIVERDVGDADDRVAVEEQLRREDPVEDEPVFRCEPTRSEHRPAIAQGGGTDEVRAEQRAHAALAGERCLGVIGGVEEALDLVGDREQASAAAVDHVVAAVRGRRLRVESRVAAMRAP